MDKDFSLIKKIEGTRFIGRLFPLNCYRGTIEIEDQYKSRVPFQELQVSF